MRDIGTSGTHLLTEGKSLFPDVFVTHLWQVLGILVKRVLAFGVCIVLNLLV